MSYYVGLPLVFLTALAEAAFLPYFRVFGLQPNLLLVVLLAWIMVRGQDEAFYLIPVGALVLGLVDGAGLGVALLGLAPLAVLHDLRGSQLGQGQLVIAVLFTVLATVIYQGVYLSAFAIEGRAGSVPSMLLSVVLPVSLINVALMLPVYWLTWIFSGDVRRAMFA